MGQNWRRMVMVFLADTEAAVGTEHALLLTLIALAILAAMTTFGSTVSNTLYQTTTHLIPSGS